MSEFTGLNFNDKKDYERTIELENITISGGDRISARLFDYIFYILTFIPFIYIKTDIDFLSFYSFIVIMIFELIIPFSTRGKTIGKAILGQRMISCNGQYVKHEILIRFLYYVFPSILFMISWFGFLFSYMFFIMYIISLVFTYKDKYNQAIHDKISNIYVVKDKFYQRYLAEKKLSEKIQEEIYVSEFKGLNFSYEKDYEKRTELKNVTVPNLKNITVSGGERILARLIDSLVNIILVIPILIWMLNNTDKFIEEGAIKFFSQIILYSFVLLIILEFIIPIMTRGKTIGKAAMGHRIISKTGEYVDGSQLFIRFLYYSLLSLLRLIPLFGDLISFGMFILFIISLVFIFTDDYHQAVHDQLSNIYVVYDDAYQRKLKKYR